MVCFKWNHKWGEGKALLLLAPNLESNIYVVCEVRDIYNAVDKDSILVLVRDPSNIQTGELVAHYLFAKNADDESGYGNHGALQNCSFTKIFTEI